VSTTERPLPAFRPVRAASLADSVVAQLRRAIVNGEIAEGYRLRETDLAEQFQVSRATIRQGLAQLRYEGLIEIRPHRGAIVSRMSLEAAYDVCVVRGVLEGWAARTACTALSPYQLDQMRALCADMGERLRAGDVLGLVAADIAFHRVICEADANEQLREHWQSLNALHGALMSTHLAYYTYDPEGVAAMHDNLCDVLAERNPDLAEQSVRLHYMRVRGAGDGEQT
jgi:DNA-binding GntR family transcriptional regulator